MQKVLFCFVFLQVVSFAFFARFFCFCKVLLLFFARFFVIFIKCGFFRDSTFFATFLLLRGVFFFCYRVLFFSCKKFCFVLCFFFCLRLCIFSQVFFLPRVLCSFLLWVLYYFFCVDFFC